MEWEKKAICRLDSEYMSLMEAKTSIGDPGLPYATGCFDTMIATPEGDGVLHVYRMGGSQEYTPDELRNFVGCANHDFRDQGLFGHLDRFEYSANSMEGIGVLPVSKGKLAKILKYLLLTNGRMFRDRQGKLPKFYVRIMLWKGNTDANQNDQIGVANEAPVRYAVLATSYSPYLKHNKEKPLGAMIVDWPRLISPKTMNKQAKLFPRYGLMANGTYCARKHGFQEALLKDEETGFIGEGGGENIVCYSKGKFIVPASSSALDGFSQHGFTKFSGHRVERAQLTKSDLKGMQSIHLTGTASGIETVFRLGDEEGNEIWRPRYTQQDLDNRASNVPTAVLESLHNYENLVSGKGISRQEKSLITSIVID